LADLLRNIQTAPTDTDQSVLGNPLALALALPFDAGLVEFIFFGLVESESVFETGILKSFTHREALLSISCSCSWSDTSVLLQFLREPYVSEINL
jgi:hypothetical protein